MHVIFIAPRFPANQRIRSDKRNRLLRHWYY